MNTSPNVTYPETMTGKNYMMKRAITAVFAAVAIAGAIPATYAQMGGAGPGMMGGYGQGQGGYGPGMMYGYGQGQDGYGPGMMGGYGGYGMGPGMMGGYGGNGVRPGMMYGYGADHLNLTDDQREKITKIQEALSTKHWELMGKMQEQRFKLREQISSGKADDVTVGKLYKNIEALRQQMWASGIDAQKQMDAVLTKEQRDQLQRGWGRGAN